MIDNAPRKYQDVLRVANDLYGQQPDWVTFFREVLGVGGAARQAFPDEESLLAFEQSEEFESIQHMLVKLRAKTKPVSDGQEPTRVITVRLPQSLHDALRDEAHKRRTSMNKLCISKLLQVIDGELIPTEAS